MGFVTLDRRGEAQLSLVLLFTPAQFWLPNLDRPGSGFENSGTLLVIASVE
jgi:hypothetical protein